MSVTDMTGASDAEFEARIAPFEADDGRRAAFSYLDRLIRHSTNPTLLSAAQAVRAEMLADERRDALASPVPAPQDDTDQGSTAADSGALISDRRQGAARTVSPVVDHHSERSAPASQDGAR